MRTPVGALIEIGSWLIRRLIAPCSPPRTDATPGNKTAAVAPQSCGELLAAKNRSMFLAVCRDSSAVPPTVPSTGMSRPRNEIISWSPRPTTGPNEPSGCAFCFLLRILIFMCLVLPTFQGGAKVDLPHLIPDGRLRLLSRSAHGFRLFLSFVRGVELPAVPGSTTLLFQQRRPPVRLEPCLLRRSSRLSRRRARGSVCVFMRAHSLSLSRRA
jgi:hypothetical protein